MPFIAIKMRRRNTLEKLQEWKMKKIVFGRVKISNDGQLDTIASQQFSKQKTFIIGLVAIHILFHFILLLLIDFFFRQFYFQGDSRRATYLDGNVRSPCFAISTHDDVKSPLLHE